MVNWVLVFFVAGQPQDYKIHTGYNKQENCIVAQERYRGIFTTTQSKIQAECRPRDRIQVNRPTSIVYKKETVY
jgi:hypothetical protein